jgi:hypothetical protein
MKELKIFDACEEIMQMDELQLCAARRQFDWKYLRQSLKELRNFLTTETTENKTKQKKESWRKLNDLIDSGDITSDDINEALIRLAKIRRVVFKNNYANIAWSDDIGWGEIQIYVDEKHGMKILIDSENMGKDFVKQVLENLVDSAYLKHEEENV